MREECDASLAASEDALDNERDETSLWNGISRFERATDEEVRRHIPIVRKMIELYGYGDALRYDEKLAAGMIGVAIAIERFDPARNVKFSYWLSYQIDKAIRNESRLVTRPRRLESSPPTDRFDPLDEGEWSRAEARLDREERARLAAAAVKAIDALEPRARRVVRGLIFEGRTQEELARELGVSQSWTSRLARAAFRKLRFALAK